GDRGPAGRRDRGPVAAGLGRDLPASRPGLMTDRAVLRGTPRPAWGERVSSLGYRLARPVLFRTGDAEAIHERTVRAVGTLGSSAVLRAVARAVTGPRGDEVEFAGLRFPGPVGLAAGMDKYGMAV